MRSTTEEKAAPDKTAKALTAFAADIAKGIVHAFTEINSAVVLNKLKVMHIDNCSGRRIDLECVIADEFAPEVQQDPDIAVWTGVDGRPLACIFGERLFVVDARFRASDLAFGS